MTERIFCIPTDRPALIWAADQLQRMGQTVTRTPGPEVTHVLLGVPCKDSDAALADLLEKLPAQVTVIGGKLDRPILQGRRCIDLLKDEAYLWKNAAITAHAALILGAKQLSVTLDGTNVLILGWGRIGQCLARLLQALGAKVTVAARRETHWAQIAAMGYMPLDIRTLSYQLSRYRIIYNTVPAPVLSSQQLSLCRPDCVKLELSSADGMDCADVLTARGLPGTYVPETSGRLIAATALRLCVGEEQP